MRQSAELDELRQRLQATASELGQQLERARQPLRAFEVAPVGDRLEEITEAYVTVSNRTGDAIMDAADEQDAQAIEQLTRLIGLDLDVAQRLIGQAALEGDRDTEGGPESFIQSETDPALRRQLEALDDLGAVATEALRERPPRVAAEAFPPARAAEPVDIDKPIGSIVDDAGATVTTTFNAIAWANAVDDFAVLAGRIAGGEARQAVDAVVAAARGLWKRASRLAASVLGAVIEKITKFLGGERFQRVIDAIKNRVGEWWHRTPGDGVASEGLGIVLQRAAVLEACEARLAGQSPALVAAAVEAAHRLADSNHEALHWIRRGNQALEWAGVVKPFLQLTGAMTLVALVGVALATYTVWVAHDHLDSPTLADHIPDRVRGIRQTVDAVLAG